MADAQKHGFAEHAETTGRAPLAERGGLGVRPPPPDDAVPARRAAAFMLGVRSALDGVTFTFRQPSLRKLTAAPALVQLAIFLVGFTVVLPWLYERLAPDTSGFLGVITAVATGVASATAVFLGALLLCSVVCDPLYDAISEQVERLCTDTHVTPRLRLADVVSGVVRELAASAARVVVWTVVAAPLWLLSFTGVGFFVAAPLLALWSAVFVAVDAVGRSQARHGAGPVVRIRAVLGAGVAALGFGATALGVMMLVPFAMPVVMVGGTRLFLRLASADALPSNFSLETKALLRQRLR